MTRYSLDVVLSQFGTSPLFPVQFLLLLPDLHTDFLRGSKVVWNSHLLKNFPQFIVIHTVKVFGTVSKAEIRCFFWNSFAFLMIQWMLAIWSLCLWFDSFAFSISSLNVCKLEKFEHYFASVWDECNCIVVSTFFGIAFLWDWNENWPFPVL